MAIHRLLRTEPSTETRNLGGGETARVIKEIACTCRLLPFVLMLAALYSSAQSAKYVVKYVNVRQLLENSTPNNIGHNKVSEQISIKFRNTICIGKLPLVLAQKTYYYDAVVTVLTGGQKNVDISINLHPTNTACDPRCEEPSLNSISTSIPLTREAHVTVPITQFGYFSRATSSDSTTDLVYRVRQDPVAYLDLSVEFE